MYIPLNTKQRQVGQSDFIRTRAQMVLNDLQSAGTALSTGSADGNGFINPTEDGQKLKGSVLLLSRMVVFKSTFKTEYKEQKDAHS